YRGPADGHEPSPLAERGRAGRVRAAPGTAGGALPRHARGARHDGTASLMAAMDVATGKVHAKDIECNNSVTFVSFLEEIDERIEPCLDIHVVMDNGSSHTSKATKAWLAEHPRFVVHHTPVHAS
ncbi:MAG: transposase, partial [Acidimicrobiales bacterium]